MDSPQATEPSIDERTDEGALNAAAAREVAEGAAVLAGVEEGVAEGTRVDVAPAGEVCASESKGVMNPVPVEFCTAPKSVGKKTGRKTGSMTAG